MHREMHAARAPQPLDIRIHATMRPPRVFGKTSGDVVSGCCSSTERSKPVTGTTCASPVLVADAGSTIRSSR